MSAFLLRTVFLGKNFNKSICRTYTKELRKTLRSNAMNGLKSKSRPSPGTVTLQIVGNGAQGAPASVYLFTDQSRYLFNCGEGTQRLAHEHKTKLARLQHIFFTSRSWRTLGGLPGLTLTAQDAGVSQLTLHGPPELTSFFQGMRRFVILKKMQIDIINSLSDSILDDEVMTLNTIPIFSADSEMGDSPPNPTLLYICKLKPRPGTLDLKKCVAKGVPPGPLLGLLKNGTDVVLDNGTVVKSVDVTEPSVGNEIIVFVDAPHEGYINSLESQFEHIEKASVVIHFTPQNVAISKSYKTFLDKFDKHIPHIVLNETNKFSGCFAAHRIQYQLNQLNEDIFPILGESVLKTIPQNIKRSKLDVDLETPVADDNILNADFIPDIQTMTTFKVRPPAGLDRSQQPLFTPDEYIRETHAVEGFTKALETLRSNQSAKEANGRGDKTSFPNLVFLGTGSCIPNKTRNVSAILVQTKEDSFFLLDCGEGTLGQIIRFYGPTGWQNVIKNIKGIFISHLHADHHIGIIGILQQRGVLLGKEAPPIHLFAPKQMQSWLIYYNASIEPISDYYKLFPNSEMIKNPLQSTELESMGIKGLSTCLVRHCPHSFGILMELVSKEASSDSENFKITYSGDTMPCNDLIHLGTNSTILIHEATMEDDLIEEAKAKMHCTVSEALDVAKAMNAKYTILTHFSQRYAKLPMLPEDVLHNVAIAFDFMEVTVNDLKDFCRMYPVMKIMFTEHYEEMERKMEKRLLKSERKRKSSDSLS